MFAIRSRRKSISEKDFLDAVQKVRCWHCSISLRTVSHDHIFCFACVRRNDAIMPDVHVRPHTLPMSQID